MEKFSCRTQIIAGAGSRAYIRELGIRRLLMVTDPFFVKNGVADELLKMSGAEYTALFDKVEPDPSVELAAEGTALVRSFHPDTVMALGGGSAMDCAKAMVYFSELPVRLVAIPTTSGSGSEVTDFAVLTCKKVKHPLVDERICPQIAILDGELLAQLPKSLIADAGFDVLCHAAEAFVARDAGAVTDALAKEAFGAAFALLPASYAGNVAVRERIHSAATMAGMAFTQAGLGLCHAMAHSLGGVFHIPHGRLGAMLLPAVIECNAHVCGAKYASLARGAGITGSADAMALRNLKNGLVRLRRELGMPQNLKEAGIDPRQVRFHTQQLVETTLKDPCCKTNPMEVKDFMVRRILEEVTGRG